MAETDSCQTTLFCSYSSSCSSIQSQSQKRKKRPKFARPRSKHQQDGRRKTEGGSKGSKIKKEKDNQERAYQFALSGLAVLLDASRIRNANKIDPSRHFSDGDIRIIWNFVSVLATAGCVGYLISLFIAEWKQRGSRTDRRECLALATRRSRIRPSW